MWVGLVTGRLRDDRVGPSLGQSPHGVSNGLCAVAPSGRRTLFVAGPPGTARPVGRSVDGEAPSAASLTSRSERGPLVPANTSAPGPQRVLEANGLRDPTQHRPVFLPSRDRGSTDGQHGQPLAVGMGEVSLDLKEGELG